ncbi:hypothetical protein S14_22 [Shewanella sp. phage 1/4]|uniref:hypothetical protein n=1 Tax=Shewanella phage 1/4 TaxID=1458859 RepID=UPI0004F6E322|nr:hypothetical protein S14_22 [Shewanella sp. phage 1/4]AHK11134.1 hypothetical protein S14_22 [Shewanella sp. phage 1/4]
MAILARKNGWMIACSVIQQDESGTKVKTSDTELWVKCRDKTQKVFDGEFTMESVEAWIMEGNE